MADEIKIRVAADISAIQSQMADAAETVEQFNARATVALDAYREAAAGGDEATELLAAAMRKAEASGAGYVEAITASVAAAQAASSGGGVATSEAAPGSTAADVELQRDVAAATLEQAAARKDLNSVVADSIKNQLDDEVSLDAVAAAQERLITASEALAVAKKNLAASAQYDALAEDAESSGAAALSAAELQLAEASLAAKAAKTELNAAISQYAGRTDAEAIAVVANAQRVETETTEQLIAAKEALAAAREAEITAATEETGALEGVTAANNAVGISSRQSAAAGIGILEGRMMSGNRAASAFLSTTLGLGPVLQAAFPIIGAVALLEVLVQIGTKMYDVYMKATQAGEEIARAFDESNQKIEAGNDALALTNSRLQDQIDKLEGKPSNGLQTALLEAINLADRLQSSLASDSRELESLLKKREVGYFAAALTATVPTVGLDKSLIQQSDEIESKGYKILQTFKQEMNEAAGDKGKLAQAQKSYFDQINGLYDGEIATLKPKLDHYYELQRENNDKIATMHKLHIPTSIFTSQDVDYSPAVNALERQLRQLEDLKQRATEMSQAEPLEQKKGELGQHKGDESAANKAREKKLHDLEQAYSEEEAIYGKSANAAAAYWDQYLNTFAQGTTQFEVVLNKVNTAREQLGKKESSGDLYGKEREELKKLATEAKKDANEYQRALDEMARAQASLQKELNKEQQEKTQGALEHAHGQAQGNIDVKETQVEDNATLGLGSKQEELQALKQLHDQAYEETKQYLEKEIALYADEPKKVEEYQKQMDEANRKHLQQELNDTTKILQQEQEKYKQAYGVITQSFNQALEAWETHEQTAAQAFSRMLTSMEIGIEKLVLEFLEKKLLSAILELVGLTNTASGSSANQSTAADDKVLNPQIVESNSAAAASVVFFATGGDFAAAAEAFAEGMVFFAPASFEQGGIVAGSHGMPVPIMAHAGERVLSAPQTQNFERMVNTSSSSRALHLNYSPTVNAYDRGGMRSTLQSHKDDILDIVRGGLNSGALRR